MSASLLPWRQIIWGVEFAGPTIGAIGAVVVAVTTYFLGVRSERSKWAREDVLATRATKAPLYEAFRKAADDFVEAAVRARAEVASSEKLAERVAELRRTRKALEVHAPERIRAAALDLTGPALDLWASVADPLDREAQNMLASQRFLWDVGPDARDAREVGETDLHLLLRAYGTARDRYVQLVGEDLARSH